MSPAPISVVSVMARFSEKHRVRASQNFSQHGGGWHLRAKIVVADEICDRVSGFIASADSVIRINLPAEHAVAIGIALADCSAIENTAFQ
jgi:hypothetical protein